jgi:hypothetical protein
MNQLEQNIVNSFRIAKSDILKLQTDFLTLSQTQERVLELLDQLRAYESQLYQRVKDIGVSVSKRALPGKTEIISVPAKVKKIYTASKSGSKFHSINCPFAQNIKPKTKLIFKTKTRALNSGYKPCSCVK